MAIMNPRDIVGRAALILPEPPATLEMLAEAGGAIRIELLSRNGLEYRARAPKLRLQPRSMLRARVDAIDGGGNDVDMLVSGIEPEGKWTVIARLQVTGIHERSAHRSTARVRVCERAPLYAMSCRAIRAGEQFEVEVADLSTTGVAFVSDRAFHTGDLVALMPTVDGQPIRVRVLHTAYVDDALARVGCEIVAVTDVNRRRIARLADAAAEPDAR
jgi:hypothetical protein